MMWSLLYTALNSHYYSLELKGVITDNELEAKLQSLRGKDLEGLSNEFMSTFKKPTPKLEEL